MYKIKIFTAGGLLLLLACASCKVPSLPQQTDSRPVPTAYVQPTDSSNSADIKWKDFFSDPHLVALIDTALKNNIEVLTTLQDIELARNDVRIRKGLLYPTVSGAVGSGIDKTGRYTAAGAGNASTDITPGKEVPEPITDIFLGFRASWEADIWSKLHNAKKAAFARYLKSIEGKNFVVTNLVAEIANSYYELLALDNQLDIIRQAIQLQKNELEVVKVQKEAAAATELAVKQFEAQVYNSQSQEYDIMQQITATENRINFLSGRYPQKIERDKTLFTAKNPVMVHTGIPSQLLKNRPDIRQAELELQAAKLDVKIARAEFYPSVGISGNIGYQAFKPKYLFKPLKSLTFSLAGELVAPLINRNAIQAEFNKASAYQLQALYDYQKTILTGYVEVSNEMSNINNLEKLYQTKSNESDALTRSIDIAKDLFRSARANYLEVLISQRDALSAKLELVETRKRQFNSVTNIYKALGGGWK
jgi:NodT family efflux transporter outer membrane factor (OMF) lipoprotein